MEEIVALDSEKQRKFVKNIKGIKKLIKGGKVEKTDENVTIKETIKKAKKKRQGKEKGLVYLSHIPHGFYENEMTNYFKQFGGVTNVRVIRSKRTGKSKGHAFVEFADPSVGQVVAETMNNYLMGKRLIKASYIPPEKQRQAFRKKWNAFNNPGNDCRRAMKKSYNEDKNEAEDIKRARKTLKNVMATKKKLSDLGIDYSFFTPVDVPEGLSIKTEDTSEKITNEVMKRESEKKTEKRQKQGKSEAVAMKKQKRRKTIKQEPMGDFVKVKNDDETSEDESYVFDSDEYDRTQDVEEEFDSDIQSDSEQTPDSDDNLEEPTPKGTSIIKKFKRPAAEVKKRKVKKIKMDVPAPKEVNKYKDVNDASIRKNNKQKKGKHQKLADKSSGKKVNTEKVKKKK